MHFAVIGNIQKRNFDKSLKKSKGVNIYNKGQDVIVRRFKDFPLFIVYTNCYLYDYYMSQNIKGYMTLNYVRVSGHLAISIITITKAITRITLQDLTPKSLLEGTLQSLGLIKNEGLKLEDIQAMPTFSQNYTTVIRIIVTFNIKKSYTFINNTLANNILFCSILSSIFCYLVTVLFYAQKSFQT